MILLTVWFVPAETKAIPVIDKKEKLTTYLFLKILGYLGNVVIFGACSGAFFLIPNTVWPVVMEQHGFDATAIGLKFYSANYYLYS